MAYDNEARIFHGELARVRAIVTFQGSSVDEIEQAFKDSVNDYLDAEKEKKLLKSLTLRS